MMDGVHESFGFSRSGIAANTMGMALVFEQELICKEQAVKYIFSYWESQYSQNSSEYPVETTMNSLLKAYYDHAVMEFQKPIQNGIAILLIVCYSLDKN